MIKGLTNRPPAFPCIGTLRKGAPKPERGPGRDLDHFRFDSDDPVAQERFAAVYGPTPQSITVYLPYPRAEQNFNAWKEEWTKSQLKHRCDGELVYERNTMGELVPTAQVCPGGCKQVGRLQVIIPALERFAYVTVLTTSIYDIVALSEQLAAVEALRGSLQGIPMVLSRHEREISMPKPDGTRARVTKWMLAIEVAPEWAALQLQSMRHEALHEPAHLRALPGGSVDLVTGELFDDDPEEVMILPGPASSRQPDDIAMLPQSIEERQPREKLAACASCGAPIAWAKTKNGKNCPYDVDEAGRRLDVSHFETCPNARDHSQPAPAPTYTPGKLGHIRRRIQELWKEERASGIEPPATELALDLQTLDGDTLLELGQTIRTRLDESAHVAA